MMTDEERRQKLVATLYSLSRGDDRATLCYDAADEIERLANSLSLANDAWAKGNSEILRLQSYRDEDAEGPQPDAEPQETWNKQPPGPDSILHELGDCPTQSDAEPAQPQTLRDAAENLLIAIGMGWDLNGCAENLRAVLAQSDAEPVAWQYRWKMDLFDGGKAWSPWHDLPEGCVNRYAGLPDYETRALYTAPPRPDTSAGLIEAAELAEQCANGSFSKNEAMYLRGFADRLRARAADRSGK